MLLIGELDLDKDDDIPTGYQLADEKVVEKLLKERKAKESRKEKTRLKKLAELGFEGETLGEAVI